jgi:cobalamin biosynthesis protein CobD/CbiB
MTDQDKEASWGAILVAVVVLLVCGLLWVVDGIRALPQWFWWLTAALTFVTLGVVAIAYFGVPL